MARVAAACRSAGALTVESSVFRVIESFTQAGVFQRRHATLVGTHAFNALGNLLGVRWDAATQTMDIDLASPGNIALAQGSKWRKRLHNAHQKLAEEHNNAALQLSELWNET